MAGVNPPGMVRRASMDLSKFRRGSGEEAPEPEGQEAMPTSSKYRVRLISKASMQGRDWRTALAMEDEAERKKQRRMSLFRSAALIAGAGCVTLLV